MSKRARVAAILCALGLFSLAAELAAETPADGSKKPSRLREIEIIGNTELPNVSFDNIPWKLPTVQKRSEQAPSKRIQNMLVPIEPHRHKEQVYFNKNLKIDMSRFGIR